MTLNFLLIDLLIFISVPTYIHPPYYIPKHQQAGLLSNFLLINRTLLFSTWFYRNVVSFTTNSTFFYRLETLFYPNTHVSFIISIIISIAAYLSAIFVFQLMAFQNHTFLLYLCIYLPDIIMFIRFIFLFWTPFYDPRGVLITNKKAIRKR